jgi:hypothetical protein
MNEENGWRDPGYTTNNKIRYLLINTYYNNRCLAKEDSAKNLYSAMMDFEEILETTEYSEEQKVKKESDSDIHIIPSTNAIKLLYTVHSGYTWVDQEDAKDKVYPNDNNLNHIMEVRDMFKSNNVDDKGCFVFELPDIDVSLSCVMFSFLERFTGENLFANSSGVKTFDKVRFCGCFSLSNMYDVNYNKEEVTLYIGFDTESG